MDGGWNQRRNNHKRSQNKKPPRDGFGKPGSVGLWEREFCKVVGSMEWNVFLQKKKCIHLHPKAMDWNDIAGEEAFNNAKLRFWSQKYGLFCDIPLPDPDLYNNLDIDWDSKTEDVDDDTVSSSGEDDDDTVSSGEDDDEYQLGNPFEPETYKGRIVATGWGDDAPAVTFTASYGDLLGPD